MEIWPNFFIVGASKAGTTSLYEYLNKIPQVFMSTIKEPNYFIETIHPERLFCTVISDKKKYLKLFSDVKDEVAIGEASPFYLIDPETPKLIHKTIPNARIIVILRDPIERAFSVYLHNLRNGLETESFSQVIRNTYSRLNEREELTNNILLEGGFYFDQLKRYYEIFEPHQIKVIIFEEFVRNPEKIIYDVLKFLKIDFTKPVKLEKTHNPFGVPRGKLAKSILNSETTKKIGTKIFSHSFLKKMVDTILIENVDKPKMIEGDRLFLKKLYYDDVKKLEELLDFSLPWSITSK